MIENANLTEADVIDFSKSLRDTKTPAWQRLQAVGAIEAYRNLVLKTEKPSLQHVRQTLSSIAVKEKADGPGADRPGIEDERHLIAWSVKDVCFDEGTVLPERSRESFSASSSSRRLRTMMIYLHVMNKPGLAFKSPADAFVRDLTCVACGRPAWMARSFPSRTMCGLRRRGWLGSWRADFRGGRSGGWRSRRSG